MKITQYYKPITVALVLIGVCIYYFDVFSLCNYATLKQINDMIMNGTTINNIYVNTIDKTAHIYTDNTTYIMYLPDGYNIDDRLNTTVDIYYSNTSIKYLMYSLLYYLFIIGFVFFGILSCSRLFTKAIVQKMVNNDDEDENKWYNIGTQTSLVFDDVIGQKEAKDDLMECVGFFENRTKYISSGCKIPKGLLFSGPPGTGKTMLAKAFAERCNATFISVSGSSFIEIFVGVGPKRTRNLFKIAKEKSPSIIFIDEIDAIGSKRTTSDKGHNEQASTLNEILTQIDGFNDSENIMIIGATNRPESLDPALVRSGRFDKEIIFELPNKEERKRMFTHYLYKVKLSDEFKINFDENIDTLANLSARLSGADIANIVNQGMLIHIKNVLPYTEKALQAHKFNALLSAVSKKINDNKTKSWFSCCFGFCRLSISKDDSDDDDDDDDNEQSQKSEKILENTNKIKEHDKQPTNEQPTNEQPINEQPINEQPINEQLTDIIIKNDESDDSQNCNKKITGLTMVDIRKAIDIVMVGMEKRERTVSTQELEYIAYHEAGHALISYILRDGKVPIKVSIVPRGKNALGFSQQQSDDTKIYTQNQLKAQICICLGGRCAELIQFGQLTTGAHDDIEKLTRIAKNMIMVYGMGNSGAIHIDNKDEKIVRSEIESIVKKMEKLTMDILTNNKNNMEKLAHMLLDKETIIDTDIDELFKDDNIKSSFQL